MVSSSPSHADCLPRYSQRIFCRRERPSTGLISLFGRVLDGSLIQTRSYERITGKSLLDTAHDPYDQEPPLVKEKEIMRLRVVEILQAAQGLQANL